MPGESAREMARQQRERALRLVRQADRWDKGADGEETTGALLDSLRSEGWRTWHDVAWPGRSRANIDHVLLGPGGIFVIDSLHWSGHITLGGGVLRQDGRSRAAAVLGVEEAALTIGRALGNLPTTGVICFVRDEPIRGWSRGVVACSTATILETLRAQPRVLTPVAVQRHEAQLNRVLQGAGAQGRVARLLESGRRTTTPPTSGGRLMMGYLVVLTLLVALGVGAVRLGAGLLPDGGVDAEALDVGEFATLGGDHGRPDLRVAVTDVSRTSSADFVAPAGQRLMAVHLRVENVGSEPWTAERPIAVTLDADPAGRIVPAYGVQRARAGTVMPARPVLKPGRTMRRAVLFVVPKGSKPVGVRLRLGPLHDAETRWIL